MLTQTEANLYGESTSRLKVKISALFKTSKENNEIKKETDT